MFSLLSLAQKTPAISWHLAFIILALAKAASWNRTTFPSSGCCHPVVHH
ncbi:hypothetical protein Lpp22_2425 [Lacticaseibacillus paracasei subsp. paracasei Lpp22]|uniref:Uncharacterized protein n=1 Tax=Lacticaseibacillus paracasei subsp. paracasei Lpp22 TaxID=1256221 RepID=A0A8E0M5B2_LACPA|nr:hypothetical protein Lpp22_2425 [Lacticaseibacillus paracasei subsp. paracasei Lpp22]